MIDWYRFASGMCFFIAIVLTCLLLIRWSWESAERQYNKEYEETLRDWCRWEMWGPDNIKTWVWEIYTKC